MKQILIISLFITLSLLNIYGQNKLSIGKQDFLYKEDNNKIGLPKPKEKRIIFLQRIALLIPVLQNLKLKPLIIILPMN